MATLLHRIDSERNERRYYLVEAGPSLLDEYAVLRYWGRIGGGQRRMITPCTSAEEMEKLAGKLVGKKVKRGYWIVQDEGGPMIKFAVNTKEKGLLMGFGLSEGNIERLKAGQPIMINLEDMGLMKGSIMIFYGKTEAEMAEMLKPFIGPETKVIGEPPGAEAPAHTPPK